MKGLTRFNTHTQPFPPGSKDSFLVFLHQNISLLKIENVIVNQIFYTPRNPPLNSKLLIANQTFKSCPILREAYSFNFDTLVRNANKYSEATHLIDWSV